MPSPEIIYKERVGKYSAQSKKQKKCLGLISFLRLLSFIIAFISLFFLIKVSAESGIIISMLFLVCFFVLVKRFNVLARKNAHTTTHKGKQILADWLSFPCKDVSLILRKQEAVRELAAMTDNRQNFRVTGKLNSETSSEMQNILEWLQEKNRYYGNTYYHLLCYLSPALTLVLLTATAFNQSLAVYVVYLFIIQLLIVAMHLRFNNHVHEKMGKKLELFEQLEKGNKLFIVLDEILKGTNSADKQKGSRAVLEKIIFDYKLYDGITKKMNALLLMQQMGIISEN
ncbi:MAG TPA: hypothetical protein VJ346_05540 [Bacteroidales bacterium]|nr:hypothetical protein [Bacteroidales bacterium]